MTPSQRRENRHRLAARLTVLVRDREALEARIKVTREQLAAQDAEQAPPATLAERILHVLATTFPTPLRVAEIANALDLDGRTIANTVARLRNARRIVRVAPGLYRALRP